MLRESVDRLRAMEALRAGVPNRDVVRQLRPHQEEIEDRFQTLLDTTEGGWPEGVHAPGLLLEGDFGTGKSHWLEYFQHMALVGKFVCSTVVINKETPLHDLAKVYRSAAGSAVAQGTIGPLLAEVPFIYQADKAPYYQELLEWVAQNASVAPRLAATLFLFQRTTDPELRKKVVAEWIGDPMRVGELKRALRELGEPRDFGLSRPVKEPILHRFEFLTRFFRSSGYRGWVILLDETEMVAKYSLRQRGRAYANMAQLLGMVKTAPIPGVASVFTITKDYAGQVLFGRKNDVVNIPARLQGTRDEAYAAPAEIGMRTIRSKGVELRPPTREQLHETYERVRALYSDAYGWNAGDIEETREYAASTGMRQYVRSWINVWDLRRLYDYDAHLVAERPEISYEEDADMQIESRDEEPVITT
jgi:BREX system ATP-binding protein BrxC/D